jgi:hypothetical protein
MLPKMLPKNDFFNNSNEKYSFPKKYNSTGEEYEFALIVSEGKAYITDQGRTIKMLDNTFELKEPDVRKNIDAIARECGVIKHQNELRIEIPSWSKNPMTNNTEIDEVAFRLFICVAFMDTMRIFYV